MEIPCVNDAEPNYIYEL